MSRRERTPDAVVTATDRDGRLKNQENLFLVRDEKLGDPMEILQAQIGKVKGDFMSLYGSECYTFVNVYC